MPKPPRSQTLKVQYPGLSDKVARHVVRRLQALDWQQLQQIAASCCRDCPGKADPAGPPCEHCPLRPIALDAAILAAQARSAQRPRNYLDTLPTTQKE